ncbi:ATP-grasp domain-containing protein [Cohnella xylanilytica]|uniref:ATP-grasp domain-containing protein n=1 Tax=Cohnella xylanilytica TaxID=557555 RepID=A0A841UCW1_9BACL|nr:ATP-grasp domain-containing protein [Cohnella xylanilytica]MBB6696043.1 ATP-grasp domain-containing protein [Cohnella xylanilytica]
MTTSAGPAPLRILLTGGRSPAALEFARLFRAAGHRVYAAESAPYHLCRASACVERSFQVPAPAEDHPRFVGALIEIARANGIDVLVPTCEEIFHLSRELHRFDGVCRVFAAPLGELDRLHHKGSFIRAAEDAGLAVPATEPVESPDGWLPLLEDPRFADGLVLKPAYSRFASRTLLLDPSRGPISFASRQEIVRKLKEAQASQARPWVAQRLLRGEEWCTYSVAHEGIVAAHVAYRSRFRAGRGASIHYAAEKEPRLLEWVRRFAKHTGFSGQLAFDFIRTSDGVFLPLECNPRATSGIHLFGAEGRLAEAILAPGALLAEGRVAEPAAKDGRGAMLSAAMLSYGLTQAIGRRKLGEWLRAYRSGRDVVYRRDDPKPFAEQFRLLAWTWRVARRRSLSMQEASTIDIEWNGER